MAAMQPGIFIARIINYALSNNSKGNPQIEVLFEYTDGVGLSGTPHQVRWWGQTTEKALPYTLKALLLMGYQGKTDDDFSKLADGVEGGMLDLGTEVELVLENETNEAGKTFVKIKYINAPGGAGQGVFKSKNALTRSEARVKLGAMNLAGQMAMIKAEMGVKDQPKSKAPIPSTSEPTYSADDIPF